MKKSWDVQLPSFWSTCGDFMPVPLTFQTWSPFRASSVTVSPWGYSSRCTCGHSLTSSMSLFIYKLIIKASWLLLRLSHTSSLSLFIFLYNTYPYIITHVLFCFASYLVNGLFHPGQWKLLEGKPYLSLIRQIKQVSYI